MKEPVSDPGDLVPKRQYTWPWFVLAALLLAIALAILWMSFEIKRTRRNRDLNAPQPGMRGTYRSAEFQFCACQICSQRAELELRAPLPVNRLQATRRSQCALFLENF